MIPGKEPLKRLKPAAEKVADLAKKVLGAGVTLKELVGSGATKGWRDFAASAEGPCWLTSGRMDMSWRGACLVWG